MDSRTNIIIECSVNGRMASIDSYGSNAVPRMNEKIRLGRDSMLFRVIDVIHVADDETMPDTVIVEVRPDNEAARQYLKNRQG